MINHKHSKVTGIYGCEHPKCVATLMISCSIEDLRCSLAGASDMTVLLHALLIAKKRKEKTKTTMIDAKIKKLIKAQDADRKLRMASGKQFAQPIAGSSVRAAHRE